MIGYACFILLRFFQVITLIVIAKFSYTQKSFNRSLTSENSKKEVKIVVYDNIKGFLNWHFDWFQQAALDKCKTR